MKDKEVYTLLKKFLDKPKENKTVDFKEKLTLKHDREKKELAKDIACFANTDGGYIVVGVVDQSWDKVGINSRTFNKKAIRDVARSRVNPPAIVDIYEKEIGCLNYGMIIIKNSTQIHGVRGVYYRRVDDECIPQQPHELLELQSKKVEFRKQQLEHLKSQIQELKSSEQSIKSSKETTTKKPKTDQLQAVMDQIRKEQRLAKLVKKDAIERGYEYLLDLRKRKPSIYKQASKYLTDNEIVLRGIQTDNELISAAIGRLLSKKELKASDIINAKALGALDILRHLDEYKISLPARALHGDKDVAYGISTLRHGDTDDKDLALVIIDMIEEMKIWSDKKIAKLRKGIESHK